MSRRGGSVYEERDTYIRDEAPRSRPPPSRPRDRDSVYEERDTFIREEPARRPPVQVRERDRDYEEIDFIRRERREPDRRLDFLREDYGKNEGGTLVVRERDKDIFSRPLERRPRSPSPVRYREKIIERERERSTSPPPQQLRARVIETRERIPVRERSPSPVRYRERIIERERGRSPSPVRSERIRITETREERRPSRSPSPSPSPSPPPPIIRAPPIHQEVITHHRHIDHGTFCDLCPIEIHSNLRSQGYEVRARVPSPPPPPRRSSPPRVKETDIDIYTSRNNTEVDIHTKNRSRTPQASPHASSNSLPPRRDNYYDDTVIYEQEHDKLKVRDNMLSINRRRSLSARPGYRPTIHMDIRDDENEADYYNRKMDERAYIGEAYNGATKDWSIVDVPPGTERVRMDGVGGGSEEITWQRYNGVRRSKFIPQREPERERERVEIREDRRIEEPRRENSGLEIQISTSNRRREGSGVYEREREYERIEESSDRRLGPPRAPKNRVGDLWTEITKDLVVAEAIQQLGYDYEETEYFFYVLQYLRYVRPPTPHMSQAIANNHKGRRPPASQTLGADPP